MSRYSLAVVETHPTQFDGPLFRKIGREEPFDLTVYYLRTDRIIEERDEELGFSPDWDIPITEGYRSLVCPQGFFRALSFFWRECLRSGRYDLVILPGYAHLGLTIMSLAFRLQVLGMRLDTAPIYPESAWWSYLKRFVLRRIFRRFAAFHPTGSLTEGYLQQMGVSPQRMYRFPYSVDNQLFEKACLGPRANRESLLRGLKISPQSFVVLGVLKFVPRENPLELLRGFRLFHERFPGSDLILVGSGLLQGEIDKYIAESGLTGAVHLVGYSRYSELPKWYAIANVFVHPAEWECWGVSVNEAMACGLPVVASSRVGSSYDLVKDGLNGYQYPFGDSEALAQRLFEIATMADRGQSLGECSRRLIAHWDHDATIDSLAAALRAVAPNTVAPMPDAGASRAAC
jgi:glycosyltransferase involved in cell wall biosynthesis